MSNRAYDEPAFPATEAHGLNGGYPGLTLRDYFAAKAIEGCCAGRIDSSGDGKDYAASHAYLMADAMLRARAK